MGKAAEIWMGNNLTYRIAKVKRIQVDMIGSFVLITAEDGRTFETSPHNVVIITTPKGGAEG
jgi:ribosomal protein S4E